MDYEDRQKYDKAVDDMLKEKLKLGLPFAIFAFITIIGVIGVVLYFAFK